MKNINKIIVALLVALVLPLFLGASSANAANFTQAYLRYSRMKTLTAADVVLVITPATVGTEDKIIITFGAGTSVAETASWGVGGTGNLPAGTDIVPGTLTVASSGNEVTVSGVTDLTVGTDYAVELTGGIVHGTAAMREDNITTKTSGNATIDTSNVATRIVTNGYDQLTLLATVPPSFDFVLSANSDSFTTDLSPTAVVSTAGKTVTVTTNADKGWIAWVKSQNTSLDSATVGSPNIETSGTINAAPTTLSTASNGYVLDVDLTTDHGTGTGTVTIDPEYLGADTSSGGTLSTTFQPIASANGTTAGDVLTLIARATISAVQAAADDYTDTLTVVGAGNF